MGLNPGTFPTTPTRVMPGTSAAPLGAPSATKFNGLGVVQDTLHRMPLHAVPAIWGTLPSAQAASTTPSLSDVAVLSRRDALIVYVPAVQGAADYRAYVVSGPGHTITFSGTQPRGATIACAGYRQRFWGNVDGDRGSLGGLARNRELVQAIEIPGLKNDGTYQVVVEAIATPCPFTGIQGNTSAELPLQPDGIALTNNRARIRSSADVKAQYGNMILNGQGAMLADFVTTDLGDTRNWNLVNRIVPPTDTTLPADPRVIARSALRVVRPADDEALNAPLIDVGPNAVFDDFTADNALRGYTRENTRGCGPGVLDGWAFWHHGTQPALVNGSLEDCKTSALGVQVWKEHGRLYTTSGDDGGGIFSQLLFTSTRTRPLELSSTKYAHSFFRVDSHATIRRYWVWFMCGGATRDELVDPATNLPRVKPLATVSFDEFSAARNLTAPVGNEATTSMHNKECLNLIQRGAWPVATKPADTSKAASFYDVPHSELRAFVHPAGRANGLVNLSPAPFSGAIDGIPWRMNAQRKAAGPMFEPFDQLAPLGHFDIFVRPDRVVFYVNGRQAWCADLSKRPLSMKYGLVGYGQVLYHSAAEIGQNYAWPDGSGNNRGGSFNYLMNTPWTDTRAWDAVGHSEIVDIPAQMKFDPALCFEPASTAVR
ncbi:MAG: hypothetical protein H7Y33_14865 [Cytophagales bacterium]|nr:hypothetical protein [Rhizobacter sp.]